MKRMLVFTMIVLCIVFVLPSTARAETVKSGICGDNVAWTLDDSGTLTISGTGAMNNYPSQYFEPFYPNYRSIKSVVIEEGVTTIGDFAFSGCSNLISIIIPSSVVSIGTDAFFDCISLRIVSVPESVTRIGRYAFDGCTNLSSVTIPKNVTNIGDNAFQGCAALISAGPIGSGCNIEFGWIAAIPAHSFYKCSSLINIIIPESMIAIGTSAFYGCSSLSDVYFGGSEAQWNAVSGDGKPSNVTVHYYWGKYLIDFDANGGTGNMELSDVKQGDALMLPECGFAAPDGMRFKAWVIDNTQYPIGATYNVMADTTVMALWETIPTATPTIIIGSGIVSPGETLEIPMTLLNNPGFVNLGIQIDYDSDVLTLESVVENTVGGTYASSRDYSANPYVMTWRARERRNQTYNGELAVLRFRIKSGAAEGDYPITINYYTGPDNTYRDGVDVHFDLNYQPLNLSYVNGSIVVKGYPENADVTMGTMGEGKEIAWLCDGQSWTITIAGPVGPLTPILVADYDEVGRMLSTGVITQSGEEVTLSIHPGRVKIFWIGNDGAPLCENAEIQVE